MGTSRLKSKMCSVYTSLIHHFITLFELNDECKNFLDTIEAKEYLFNKVLQNEKIKTQKIAILLDAIDQLKKIDYSLTWLHLELPNNIKMIYSVLDNYGGIVEAFKQNIEFNERNYLEIIKMDQETAMIQLEATLKSQNRKLQDSQWYVVKECFNRTTNLYPLHVKLLSDITVKWVSTYEPSLEEIAENCKSIDLTIEYIFKKHELFYGFITFPHFIFYLTIFTNGITQNELEDILSIDDNVLNEVFGKHEPPIRRFPNSVLIRLLDDLKAYLTEKETDGSTVICWFHSSFYKIAKQYYSELFNFSETKDRLLQNIIDYFDEKWSTVRFTKIQTMKSRSEITNEVIYNKRKMNELLNIILLLDNYKLKIDYLRDYIYFNYQFMHCKAELGDLQFILETNEHLIDLYNIAIQNETTTSNSFNYKYKANKLLEISKIYEHNYGLITAYPDSILYETISRLEYDDAEKLKQSISTEAALVPIQNGFKPIEKREKILFSKNENIYTLSIKWCINSNYLIVESCYENSAKIKVINHINGIHLNGEISIPMKWSLKIVFFNQKPNNDILSINEIDGGIICVKENIKIMSFRDSVLHTIKISEEKIKESFLLSLNALFILYKNSFEIIRLTGEQYYRSELFLQDIIAVKSTLPQNDEVFMPEFDLIESKVICIFFINKILIYDVASLKNSKEIQYLTQIFFDSNIYFSQLTNSTNYNDVGCFIDRSFSVVSHNRSIEPNKKMSIFTIHATQKSKFFIPIKIEQGVHLVTTDIFYDETGFINYKSTDIQQDISEEENFAQFYDFYLNKIILALLYELKPFYFVCKSILIYDTSN